MAQASRRHAAVVDICMHHSSGGVAGLLNANDDGDYAGAGAEAGARPRQDGGREALQYIRSLPRAEREQLLQQHGKALISKFKLEMEVRASGGMCRGPGSLHALSDSIIMHRQTSWRFAATFMSGWTRVSRAVKVRPGYRL